jgi:hypothetical protein
VTPKSRHSWRNPARGAAGFSSGKFKLTPSRDRRGYNWGQALDLPFHSSFFFTATLPEPDRTDFWLHRMPVVAGICISQFGNNRLICATAENQANDHHIGRRCILGLVWAGSPLTIGRGRLMGVSITGPVEIHE